MEVRGFKAIVWLIAIAGAPAGGSSYSQFGAPAAPLIPVFVAPPSDSFASMPSDGNASLLRALAALEARDFARAARLAATGPRPADPLARYVAGVAQAGQGNLVAARRLLKAAVAGRPDGFTEAEATLALVHVRLGDRDAARGLRNRLALRLADHNGLVTGSRIEKAVALIDRALG